MSRQPIDTTVSIDPAPGDATEMERLLAEAWATDVKGINKLVLVGLVLSADNTGTASLSVAELAQHCSVGEQTILRTVEDLEASGYLLRQDTAADANRYLVLPSVARSLANHRTA